MPIVSGAHPDDYARIAPPHSYIHAEWFISTAALAHYLQYLAQNETAYLEYFQWRNNYAMSTTGIHCRLCSLAHEVLASSLQGGNIPSESSEDDDAADKKPLSGGFVPSTGVEKSSFNESDGDSMDFYPGHKSPFDIMLRSQYYNDVHNWWNCFQNSGAICTRDRWSSPLPEFLHF